MDKKLYSLLFQIVVTLLFTQGPAMASDSMSSVVVDSNGAITSTDAGFMEPDEYYITVYEIGLCTSFTAPDTQNAIGYSNAAIVYSNPSGMRVLVRNGITTPLEGTIQRPPDGTYAYGYAIVAPQFEVKSKAKFATDRYKNNQDSNTVYAIAGTVCYSKAGSVSYAYASSSNNPATATMVTTDVSQWGVTTQHQNSFGSYYVNSTESLPVYSWSNGTLNAYLVSAQGKLPAADWSQDNSIGSVQRLIGVIPVNVTVSQATKTMALSFKVSQGCTVGQSTSNGKNTLEFFGGGPFEINIAVQ